MKTNNDILTDFYQIVAASPIAALSGGIYKKIRPTNSDLEDCVISLITGTNAKFLQNAALYVKIFYKDIFQDNSYLEDSLNGSVLENLLIDLSEKLLKNNEYSFNVSSRETYTAKVDEINQHYAIMKMNFRTIIK